ncbi:MAG: hypothetical protein ACI8Y4_004995 [Candidatus Poriferisodalaceae bacterium]|jgi:hypothetical protein
MAPCPPRKRYLHRPHARRLTPPAAECAVTRDEPLAAPTKVAPVSVGWCRIDSRTHRRTIRLPQPRRTNKAREQKMSPSHTMT